MQVKNHLCVEEFMVIERAMPSTSMMIPESVQCNYCSLLCVVLQFSSSTP